MTTETQPKPNVLNDPALFAEEAEGHLYGILGMEQLDTTPAYIEFTRLRHRFLTAFPDFERAGTDHPFVAMDEAAMAAFGAAFRRGVRIAATIEAMRRELVSPIMLCLGCQGAGVDRVGEKCLACNGRGSVANHPYP